MAGAAAYRRDMKLRRRSAAPPTGYVGDHADKLSQVRPVSHAQDPERPTGADRETYHTLIDNLNESSFPGWGRRWGRRRRRKA
jgi:hypothetical protein